MAITLISAACRSGKSLKTMELIEGFFEKGRMVYVDGIEVLDKDRFPVIEIEGGFPNWQKACVPGSVIVVDEAHRYLRSDKLPRVLPDWVDKLATHSHAGMDFDIVFISQAPGHFHPFVRPLISYHHHFVRKNGAESAYMFTWDGEMEGSPHLPAKRKRAERTKWDFRKDLYGTYKSAGVHQVEKKRPSWIGKVVKSLVFMSLCIALAWWALHRLNSRGAEAAEAKSGETPVPAAAAASSASSGSQDSFFGHAATSKPAAVVKPMSPEEYARQFVPRIAELPWSAPVYDGQKPTSMPMVYCISAEEVGCRCYTEQATVYVGIRGAECRRIALEGLYNPYKAQPKVDASGPSQDAAGGPSAAPGKPVVAQVTASSSYNRVVGVGSYTPPELTTVEPNSK